MFCSGNWNRTSQQTGIACPYNDFLELTGQTKAQIFKLFRALIRKNASFCGGFSFCSKQERKDYTCKSFKQKKLKVTSVILLNTKRQCKPKLWELTVILKTNPGLRKSCSKSGPVFIIITSVCVCQGWCGKLFCLKRKPKGIMYKNLNRWKDGFPHVLISRWVSYLLGFLPG